MKTKIYEAGLGGRRNVTTRPVKRWKEAPMDPNRERRNDEAMTDGQRRFEEEDEDDLPARDDEDTDDPMGELDPEFDPDDIDDYNSRNGTDL